MSRIISAVAAVAVAAVGYVLLAGRSVASGTPSPARDQQQSENAATVKEDGVTYDDPSDSESATFEDAPNTDPETYAPDTQDGSTAPSNDDAALASPGDSQNWGDAPEASDDDLTERAADSNLDDDTKSAFDQLANADSVEDL